MNLIELFEKAVDKEIGTLVPVPDYRSSYMRAQRQHAQSTYELRRQMMEERSKRLMMPAFEGICEESKRKTKEREDRVKFTTFALILGSMISIGIVIINLVAGL